MLNLTKLKGRIPETVLLQLPETILKFELSTPLRLAHFLAQASHESGNFKAVTENLNYSAKNLVVVFKKYFPTYEKAMQFENKPEKIANLVYGGRMGNKPEASGDGYKFRGRGFIQLTGYINYKAFDTVVPEDIINNPDLVATKYPLLSAAWFFHTNGLHIIADTGSTDAVITIISKRINGGVNGLAERIKLFKQYYSYLM